MKIQILAHKLKSSSASIGAMKLYEPLAELERKCDKQSSNNKMLNLVKKLNQCHAESRKELLQILQQNKDYNNG